MHDNRSFQRFAAVIAIASFVTALTSNVLQGIPVQFNTNYPLDPLMFLSVGSAGATLLRSGLVLDMLGYYLPFLPVALLLQSWLKSKSPLWVRFYTACGLGYIFVGALGAVIMAVIQPPLIRAYSQASPDQRYVLEAIFGTLWNIVYAGMWNILGVLLAGIWFLGIGLLMRSERRGPAILAIFTGVAALSDALGNMLAVEGLAMIGLLIFLLLAPLWMLWFGIDLLRRPVPIGTMGNISRLA